MVRFIFFGDSVIPIFIFGIFTNSFIVPRKRILGLRIQLLFIVPRKRILVKIVGLDSYVRSLFFNCSTAMFSTSVSLTRMKSSTSAPHESVSVRLDFGVRSRSRRLSR